MLVHCRSIWMVEDMRLCFRHDHQRYDAPCICTIGELSPTVNARYIEWLSSTRRSVERIKDIRAKYIKRYMGSVTTVKLSDRYSHKFLDMRGKT